MSGPMTGVKVVEVGFWVAGPSVAGILADWGADVVKIEPVDGDPMRGLLSAVGIDSDENPPFELDNRGKRSVCLDLRTPRGQQIAYNLADRADVFVTNLRVPALAAQGLDYASLSARNPRLVYVAVSGFGMAGPDADRPAFDVGAFWARSGVVDSITLPGDTPPQQRGGMGDHLAGLSGACGASAALYARERTGRGQLVSTSLLRVGGYMVSMDASMNLRTGAPIVVGTRQQPPNPIMNCYRTADDRWIWLLCVQADRHWSNVLKAIDRPDLADDDRFATIFDRLTNSAELVAILDGIFAGCSYGVWAEALDQTGVWWAPVQSVDQLVQDPQAEGAGLFVDVPGPDGAVRMVSTPIDFSDTEWAPTGMSPQLGQHTEEVLLELGLDWSEIAELAGEGVIP